MTDDEEQRVMEAAALALAEDRPGGLDPLGLAVAAGAAPDAVLARYPDAGALAEALGRAQNAETLTALREAAALPEPRDAWVAVGQVLLSRLLSSAAVALQAQALSRGAAGDSYPREAILTVLEPLAARHLILSPATGISPRVAVEWFLALCLGDTQIRRLTGSLPTPPEAMIEARARAAEAAFRRLLAGPGQ